MPIINYLHNLLYTRSIGRIRSQQISYEIFYFVWYFIRSLLWIFRKAIDSIGNPDCVRIHKRMREIWKSVQNTSQHPHIHLIRYLILQIGIHNLGWSIHRCGNCFNFFLDIIILWFMYKCKVNVSIRTWSEIT